MNLREWALPIYTILMQLAAGSLLLLWIIRAANISRLGQVEMDNIIKIPILIIFITIILAMIGAHLHLSKPFQSYLAVRNFRTSWLSREIIFTLSFFLTIGCLALLQWFVPGRARLRSALGWLGILFGMSAVFCMSHIYLLPTQAAWNSPITIVSFYLTMLFLGLTALPAILLVDYTFSSVWKQGQPDGRAGIVRQVLILATGTTIIAWIMIAGLNFYQITLLRIGDQWAQTSYGLLMHLYQPLLILRLGFPLAGVVLLVISVFRMLKGNMTIPQLVMPVYASCIFVMVGETLGRFLFYAIHVRIGV